MDISLNAVDTVLYRHLTESNDFKEFCFIMDEMNVLNEAVANADTSKNLQIQKIVDNTAKTTRDIATLYGITTDAGGAGIKSIWDLMMKLLKLAAKAISFIVGKLTKIPNTIGRLIDVISSIPSEIKTKIRGDIKLYMTIDDIQVMHNQFVLYHMNNLLSLATRFSKGDMWTTFWKSSSLGAGKRSFNESTDDMKILRLMSKEFKYFKNIKITQTVVNMSDAKVVEGYFGKGVIEYTDIHGKRHKSTYYEMLTNLVKEISSRKTVLDELYSEIGDKMKRSQENDSFSKLSNVHKNAILNGMGMITTTINIIGNIVKYIMTDITTIQKATDQILKRKESIDSGKARNKKLGRDDKAIKNLNVNTNPSSDRDYDKQMYKSGYVKIPRYSKDKTGRVVDEHPGEVHKYNDDVVWVKKNNVPKGVNTIS